MSGLNAYPGYKDCGFGWLGHVPDHWRLSPLKRLGTIRYGIGEPPRYVSEGVPLIRATNVSEGKITPEKMVFVNPSDIPSARILWLREGDIVVVRSGALTGDSAIIPPEYAGAIAGFDMVFRADGSVHPKFVQYGLLSAYVKGAQLDIARMRAAQPHLNAEELGNSFFAHPPTRSEQAAIVDYLDRETAEIDAFVADQKELIELLNERRAATITQAVTKGIMPDVPMKDSGVPWLGTIPASWSVKRLKQVVSMPITDGPHETPEILDEGVPFVSAEAVSGGVVNFDKIRGFISHEDHARFSRKYVPRRDDIYMVKSGATTGVCAMVETDVVFNIWSPLAAIRCAEMALPRFVLHAMRSRNFQESVVLHWNYGTQQNIGMKVIENLPISFPTLDEQQKIADYLDYETAEIDAAIGDAKEAIELSKERRAAIISAAVTGKIDVRNHNISELGAA